MGLLVLQVAVLLVCHVWGGFVAGRRAVRKVRGPAALLLAYLAAVSVVTVSLH